MFKMVHRTCRWSQVWIWKTLGIWVIKSCLTWMYGVGVGLLYWLCIYLGKWVSRLIENAVKIAL